MKRLKKILAIFIPVVLLITTAVCVNSNSKKTVFAQGISDIIEENSKDNPFTIVEIVPNKGLGELGYSVAGQEPIDWSYYLKKLNTKNKRLNFLNTLNNQYKNVFDFYADSSLETAFSLDYKEAHVIPADADASLWTTVDSYEETKSIQTGTLTFVNSGDGDYRFSDDLNIDYTKAEGVYYQFVSKADSAYSDRAQYNKKATSFYPNTTDGTYDVTFTYDYAKNHSDEQAYEVYKATAVEGNEAGVCSYEQKTIPLYEAIDDETKLDEAEVCAKFVNEEATDEVRASYKVKSATICSDADGFYDVKVDSMGNEVLDNNGNKIYTFNDNKTGHYNVTFEYDAAGTYYMEQLSDFSLDDSALSTLYYKTSAQPLTYYQYNTGINTHSVMFQPIDSSVTIDPNKRYYYEVSRKEVESGTGHYGANYTYVKTVAPNGEYVLELKNLDSYNGSIFEYHAGTGDYVWNEDKSIDTSINTDPNGTVISLKDFNVTENPNFCFTGGLINNERFKKTIFGLTNEEASKFNIKVITVTPEELNQDNSIIYSADMFYISDNYEHSPFFLWAWENFTEDGMKLEDDERLTTKYDEELSELQQPSYIDWDKAKTQLTFNTHDLDSSTMNAIKERIQKEVTEGNETYQKTPLVYDVSLLNRVGSNNNIAALYKQLTNETNIEPGVYENVYGFYGNKTPLLSNQFTETPNYLTTEFADNFTEVTADTKNENIVRIANNLKPESYAITPQRATKYVINFNGKRADIVKNSVTILEVEPCNSFCLEDKIRSDVKKWALYFNLKPIDSSGDLNSYDNYNIKIVKMSTAEFNGKIEDLNATYDMVYFGLETKAMNTKDGQTVYNDSRLNGKIYLHVGDIIKSSDYLSGLLDRDFYVNWQGSKLGLLSSSAFWTQKYGTYQEKEVGNQRFSGNDISKIKYEDLKEYVLANYPVLFDDNFYGTYDSVKEPNRTYLDGVSYIYKFADYCLDKSDTSVSNIFNDNWLGTDKEEENASYFKTCLAIPKLLINVNSKPTEYNSDDNTINYLQPDSNNNYTLNYKIKIQDQVALVANDISYQVKLYIDVDADGRFDNAEEVKNIVVKRGSTKLDPKNIKLGKDEASCTLAISRAVPKGYTGVLPWKIEVLRNMNDGSNAQYIRSSINGYTAIKNESTNKEIVKILQINKPSGSTLNLQNQFARKDSDSQDPHNYYYTYGTNLNDFKLDITTITSTDYVNKINNNENYLDDFDMLIIGFGDCVTAINSEKAVKKIDDFASEGKCILFTHDTSIFSNVTSGTKTYSENGRVVGTALVPCGGDNNSVYRKLTGQDRYGITYDSEDDSDYCMFWDKNTMSNPIELEEKQGFASMTLTRFALKYKEYPYNTMPKFNQYVSPINTASYQAADSSNGASSPTVTTTVTKVNDGQITSYPYKINDTIKVSQTHEQYYQLNMSDEDVVVWYTLSDSSSSSRYNVLPKDVANNYYIYNKGNITYSGVGHASVPTEMEAKLFINTMIAAYKAAAEAPVAKITNENVATGDNDEQYLYVDYDLKKSGDEDVYTNMSGTTKNGKTYVDVYYRVNNPNLDMGADLSVEYYTVGRDGSEKICSGLETSTVKEPDVILPGTNGKVSVESSDVYQGNNTETDKLYHVSVPLDIFQSSSDEKGSFMKFEIKLYYVSTFKGKEVRESKTSIRFINRNLFQLN